MIYVDDTIASSELAGVLVIVGIAWALWASAWIARVEIHALAAPVVDRLGLRWAREGLRARVVAIGEGSDGRPVQLRFARAPDPGALQIWRRFGADRKSPWERIEADEL